MTERESSVPESEQPRSAYSEVPLERRVESAALNVELILRRCRRLNVQPKEWLRQTLTTGNIEELYGADRVEELRRRIDALPEVDLSDAEAQTEVETAIVDLMEPFLRLQSEDPEVAERIRQRTEQNREHQLVTGIFAYEIHDEDDGRTLELHIPPTASTPGLQQFRRSLRDIAAILEANPDIRKVTGTSLLLEHPFVERLGFRIDPASDTAFNPSFRMSRDEFLERWRGQK